MHPSDWKDFVSVCDLVATGEYTETEIAERLNKVYWGKPARSWVQPRVALASMPAYVQVEFWKLCQSKHWTSLRMADIPKLAKAKSIDFRIAKITRNARNIERACSGKGKRFRQCWREIMSR